MDKLPTEDKWWVEWCKYLGVKLPHPLQAKEPEEITTVKEIYEFFKTRNAESPFDAFTSTLKNIAQIPSGESKLNQVLKYTRLVKSHDATKQLADKQQMEIESVFGRWT